SDGYVLKPRNYVLNSDLLVHELGSVHTNDLVGVGNVRGIKLKILEKALYENTGYGYTAVDEGYSGKEMIEKLTGKSGQRFEGKKLLEGLKHVSSTSIAITTGPDNSQTIKDESGHTIDIWPTHEYALLNSHKSKQGKVYIELQNPKEDKTDPSGGDKVSISI